jgi:hypothetical protein
MASKLSVFLVGLSQMESLLITRRNADELEQRSQGKFRCRSVYVIRKLVRFCVFQVAALQRCVYNAGFCIEVQEL